MADRRLLLPEVVVPGHRLGRHINHDPRSLRYLIPETSAPATVRWTRRIPPFDQGNLGSCTIQGGLGVLGTDPYFDTLPADLQKQLAAPDVQTALAQPLYREETRLDPYDGAWEPDDTGSDGLSSAKTLLKHGWISGYQHITSVAAAHTAIKDGPFMSGLSWMSGMDTPNKEGVVHATGRVRGGHEWEFAGYDAAAGLWECWQSWGAWGKGGVFYLPDEDYAKLLAQQGDATVLVPVTSPAPTPTPAAVFPRVAWDGFVAHPSSRPRRDAVIAAVNGWLNPA